jgi:hypothetical protein
MSSAYDSYEVIGEHQESSDEYSNEAEKNWSTTDATIEVNDYVIELLEILCEANTLNEAEYTSIGYHYWGYESFSLRSNAYFMVSSVIRSPSINTNFTNNGAKTTYSHNAPITTTITNATLPTLETPLTNSLAFTDLATAKPDFINAVSEMPEPKGEKPVVPEIVPPLAVIAVASPPVGQSASTEPPEIVKSFFISMWDGVHNALDIAGLIPGVGEIADGTNGLIYLAEGDRVNAGISAASMIPFAGWGVTAGKAAKKVAGAVGDTTEQIAKHTDDIVDAGKNAAKNEKAIPVGSRAQSNHLKGRYDFEHASYDMALSESRKRLGDLGQSTKKMYDPQTGTLIGERSLDAKKGWRIDGDHVNWWDWTKGKKGSGGKYGHDFFPSKQSGPHSKGPGYAEWE